MNSVCIVGRMAQQPELKQTSSGKNLLNFTVGVNDYYAGKSTVNWIKCVAFGKSADNIAKFFIKGSPIEISGKIQTGSYEKDGRTVYTTSVIVLNWGFVPKTKDDVAGTQEMQDTGTEFAPEVKADDEDLPF